MVTLQLMIGNMMKALMPALIWGAACSFFCKDAGLFVTTVLFLVNFERLTKGS